MHESNQFVPYRFVGNEGLEQEEGFLGVGFVFFVVAPAFHRGLLHVELGFDRRFLLQVLGLGQRAGQRCARWRRRKTLNNERAVAN